MAGAPREAAGAGRETPAPTHERQQQSQLTRLLLLLIRQRPNLVAAKPQSYPIGKLLDRIRVDFNRFAAEPEETSHLDANRLNLTIGRPLDIDNLTDVPVVGAEDAHAPQIGQLPGGRLHCRYDALASS
jgi:hypothetical protein